MTTNPYGDVGHEGDEPKLPPSSQPQFVHHLALKPPPEISYSTCKRKGVKQRLFKYSVVVGISLLLLLLLVGIILAYYFSSPCMHGLQCGDGRCVWESQWCDGVTDCPAGQDEANCVRLYGSSFLLQIYSRKKWWAVCSHGWTEKQGRESCQHIGYSRGTYFKSGQQTRDSADGFLTVKSDFSAEASIVEQLELRSTCPSNSVVTLRCTDCGSGMNSSRTSGGQLASLGSWPWQVSLQVSDSHRCGGAIISPYWTVTAAHCVDMASNPADWVMYAGIVEPLGAQFSPAYSVSRIITHKGYDNLTRRNDIALIRLSKPLDLTASNNIGPVCLPNVGLNITGHQQHWITRFSPRVNGGSDTPYLMEAQVSLTDAADCNSSVAYRGRISRDMLCAEETEAASNMCRREEIKPEMDGGSPLVSLRDGVWWLIGDSILGEHCTENKLGVYANVTYFLDWIYYQMKKHQQDRWGDFN